MKTVIARATVNVISKHDGLNEVQREQQFRGDGENSEEAYTNLLANMKLFGTDAKNIVGNVEYEERTTYNIQSHKLAEEEMRE